MTKCRVRFLIQFTSTDFDAAGHAQLPIPKRVVRSGWASAAPPPGDFVRGPVLWSSRCAAWGWWVSERSSFSAQSPLGAKILPVEHTIRRWRVGTGQHAPHTTGGRTTGCNAAIPIRGGDHKVSTRLRKGAIPRVRDRLSHRHVEFKLPIG